MTVLVTGAAGLLGGHVADRLVERGERVRIFARPGEDVARLEQRSAEVYRGDLGDRASLEAAVRGVDRVLHCAARTGPWGPEAEYEIANVFGPKSLIEAAMAAGVRRIVHISSITVHGNDVGGEADEASPTRVEPNPYTRTKIAGERLVQRMIREQGAPVTIVRPGLIYGPRDTNSFGRFAALVEQGKMIRIGSGHNHVPLIYVTDAARGIVLAGEAERAVGRTYLLVNDEPVTQNDYLNAIAGELGVPTPRRHIPLRLALALGTAAELVGHLAHMQQPLLTRFGVEALGGENRFNISRARKELGFRPDINLAEGVRRGIAWYRTTRRAQSAEEAP